MDSKMIHNDAITMIIGKSFSMSGVNDIRAFDDGYILIDTVFGRVSVEGSDMKIESLNKEGGTIFVSGDITGAFSSDAKDEKKGFLKRLFG